MALFEKIKFEAIEPEACEDEEIQSSRQWTDETFTITYQPLKKWGVLFYAGVMFYFLLLFVDEGFFAFEVMAFLAIVFGARHIYDSMVTKEITLSPESIRKQGYFSQITIPTTAVVMKVDEQNISLSHGTRKNINETIKIRRYLIPPEESADIQKYAIDLYGVNIRKKETVDPVEGEQGTIIFACKEYEKSASSYQFMAAFLAIYCLIAIFSVGVSEKYVGYGPTLPAFAIRVCCFALAAAGVLLVPRLTTQANSVNAGTEPVTAKLKRVDQRSFLPAVISVGVGCLGLLLFLLFGNSLDLYGLLLVGIVCFMTSWPRLSTWERIIDGTEPDDAEVGTRSIIPRRRSLQVSLVLIGSLTAMSYGESSHYLYNSKKDCLEDWGDEKDCQEAPSGSRHYRTGRYYGPRYGSGGGRAPRSMGVGTVSRGGFGSFGSFHGSFGG